MNNRKQERCVEQNERQVDFCLCVAKTGHGHFYIALSQVAVDISPSTTVEHGVWTAMECGQQKWTAKLSRGQQKLSRGQQSSVVDSKSAPFAK